MPVVRGQAIVVECFLARAVRMASMVVSFPRPTFRIAASTSSGAGITNVPVRQFLVFVQSISAIWGRFLLSASFSRHDFFPDFGFAAFVVLISAPVDCG